MSAHNALVQTRSMRGHAGVGSALAASCGKRKRADTAKPNSLPAGWGSAGPSPQRPSYDSAWFDSYTRSNEQLRRYMHDEWGFEKRGDQALFEKLSLEGAQAALAVPLSLPPALRPSAPFPTSISPSPTPVGDSGRRSKVTLRRAFPRGTFGSSQAGLSWATILAKREDYRSAFHGFDVERCARMTDADVASLLESSWSLVKNRAKLASVPANARAVLKLIGERAATAETQPQHGHLDEFLWCRRPGP